MASTKATIDLVVNGSGAVNKLIQSIGQLQGAVDRINSQTLDLAAPGLQRRANSLSATMAGASARANDLGRDRAQILSEQRQAVERLTQAQARQQQAIERTASAERELSRLASRDELSSRRTDRLKGSLRESAAEAERLGDEMNAAAAAARALESRLGAIRNAGRKSIAAAGELIDINSTLAASNAVNALANQYNRYGDSLRRSARESKLVGTVLPGQINSFNQFRNQIEQAEASLASLRGELRRLGTMEAAIDIPSRPVGQAELLTPMSPSELGGVQAAQQENNLREQRNARRTQLASDIAAQEAGLAILEKRTETVGRNIARNQEEAARMIASRNPANTAGLAISLNQIQAQAESLALVANNSKVASTAFNRFTVAAEMSSIKLARAQQSTFTALAAGFSGGGGVNIPEGLRQEDSIAGARSMVGQLIADIPGLARSEGALNAHIQLLSQIRTILPFLSLEYRAVEEAIAGLSQELEGVGLRGQTSKIDPGAGQRFLKQREREDKIAQSRATAIDKVYQEQLGLTDKIASSKLSVTDKEDLSLRLNQALDALGESQLENAAAMTRQIADQLKLKERLAKLNTQGRGEQKVFGTLGASFLPVTGELPSTVSATGQKIRNLVPGSPAARLEEASANEKSTKAAIALAKQKLQAVEDEAEELRKSTTAATALGKQKLKALEDQAKALRDETSAAVELAQQRSKEQERMIADAWKLSGGPALPPSMQSKQKVFGTLGTSFMPISGEMPKGKSQLQAEETQKAAKEIAAQQVVINKLQNQYALEEAKGVKFSEEKIRLNALLDMLGQKQVTVSKANSAILGENIKQLRSMLGLRVLEAKVAGTYQGGSGGGKRTTTAEQIEGRRTRLLERALGVQGTTISLEAKGAQVAQERQEIEATILRLKQLQGQASEDDLKVLLKKIQNLKIANKEISNALPRTQKGGGGAADNTPFLERRFGKRGSAAISEGLIGGAFPLLFGQGLGASVLGAAGGAVGGFAGGGLGFGLSLIGTALGTAFDTLAQAAQDTGKALNYPIEGFENLKAAGLFASRQQEYYISKLIETGQSAKAAAEIQAEMIKKIGVSGVNDLTKLGDSSTKLSKAWAEFNLQLQRALAGPMAGLLEWVTSIVKLRNQRLESQALVEDVSSGLTGETKKKFDREIEAISYKGLTMKETAEQKAALAEFYKPLAKPIAAKGGKLTPEQEAADLDKAIEKADKARSLIQQGVALERGGIDLRLSVEDTVYGLRKRASDMEREAIEFRRSVEDQIFSKRQELEQKLIENERKRQQNAIDAFDLQLQKASTGLDPVAQGVVDAARDYLRIRAEGEADLQQAEKQLKLELQGIDQEVNRYKLQVEDRVSQMAIQRDEFSRDVSRARLQIERQIADRVVQVEEYRLAMAKHRYEVEIDLERKKQIVAQEGLAVPATGRNYANVGGFMGGRQMLHGIRGFAGYDESHGTPDEIHYHFAGKDPAETKAVAEYLKGLNYKITEFSGFGQRVGGHARGSQHYRGNAFDIPGASMEGKGGMADIIAGQKRVHVLINDFLVARGQLTPAARAAQDASAGASAQAASGASGAMGAAPVLQAAPVMPALPGAPQLVGINDLMQQYLEIVGRIKAATKDTNKLEADSNKIAAERAFLGMQEQAMGQVRQADQQTREIYEEIDARKLRNRLALEGVAPEIIEGEARALQLQQGLTKAVKGYDIVLSNLVGTTYDGTNATYDSALAKLKELEALGTLTPAQEGLRAELERILNARRGIIEATEGSIGGVRNAAQDSVPEPGEKIRTYIAESKRELQDLEQVAINVSQGIGNAVGNSLSSGISGLIEGTATAKEVFAGFLRDIGQMLVQEGTKMIATYVAIAIAKAFAGMGTTNYSSAFGGGGPTFNPGAFAMPKLAANGATFSNGLAQFAKGGTFTNSVVSSPTLFKFANGGTTQMGEMGEAGPEAIMPLSRGRGGRLGVDASGLREAMGRPPGGATGSPVLNMSFQSTTINGTEYVSRDQLEAAMAQTRRQAAKEGANRGMNMTLDKIQNSPSTRSRVGIR